MGSTVMLQKGLLLAWYCVGSMLERAQLRFGSYGIYDQVLNTLLQHWVNPPYCGNGSDQLPVWISHCHRVRQSICCISHGPNLRAIQATGIPYMQHWSLDVQRQLDSKTVVTVGCWLKGTHMTGAFELGIAADLQSLKANWLRRWASTTHGPCRSQVRPSASAGYRQTSSTKFARTEVTGRSSIQPRFNANHSVGLHNRRFVEGKCRQVWLIPVQESDRQSDRSTAHKVHTISFDKGGRLS
jgi:hypothetical protein